MFVLARGGRVPAAPALGEPAPAVPELPHAVPRLRRGRDAPQRARFIQRGKRKAARKAEAKVRAAIEETGCPQPLGVVVTSASKKVGRAAAWRLMRRLVLGSES